MQIDPSQLDNRARYGLMTASVIPRPVAWVSTVDEAGTANLAPFSFFAGVSSDPLTLMVSVGKRRGQRKDTANNLLATKEAVVHIPHRELAEKMVATAAEVEPEIDEFDLAGLTQVEATVVRPPRVEEAAIAMECRLSSHHEVGHAPMDVFFLEVLRVHLDDRFVKDGRPDSALMAAVGRLGGKQYCDTTEVFEIARP